MEHTNSFVDNIIACLSDLIAEGQYQGDQIVARNDEESLFKTIQTLESVKDELNEMLSSSQELRR